MEVTAEMDTTRRIVQEDIQRINAASLWEAMSLPPGLSGHPWRPGRCLLWGGPWNCAALLLAGHANPGLSLCLPGSGTLLLPGLFYTPVFPAGPYSGRHGQHLVFHRPDFPAQISG